MSFLSCKPFLERFTFSSVFDITLYWCTAIVPRGFFREEKETLISRRQPIYIYSFESKKPGFALAVIRVLIIGCRSLAIFLSKSHLAVVPTSACAFYIITLLICDEVIGFGFLGLVIQFANLLRMFEVTTLARWISLTAHIASKQFPGLCSFKGVTAECFATNWDLINFALLASRLNRAHQGHQVKCTKCRRHLASSRVNLNKN